MKLKRIVLAGLILGYFFFGALVYPAFCRSNKDLRDEAMLLALQQAEERYSSPSVNPETVAETAAENETLAPPIQKGAWTLKKNQFYAELYTKYYWHNHMFDDNNHKRRWAYDGRYNELRSELKLEYGLSDRLTLLVYTVAKEAHWKDIFASYTTRGFVEMWTGAKQLLFSAPFICSLQGRVKFPFDYSENHTPSLGTHQIDGEMKVLTAQSWPRLPGYTKAELGYRLRNEKPANEIPYFFELGYNLTKRIILKTTIDGQEGLAQTGGTDEDWIKGTCGPIFKLNERLSLEAGFGNTFFGKNTSAAKEVYVSVSSLW